MVEGELLLKDQVQEYVDQGNPLENWSYLDYFLGTYDSKVRNSNDCHHGLIANICVPYHQNQNRAGHCRVLRPPGHETMPYFLSQWFPKCDHKNVNSLFEASMLALLKPWRSLTDLKTENKTFQHAFNNFIENASDDICITIENIEFFHQCLESVHSYATSTAHADKSTPCS